jgi:hypothetical protein
MTVVGEKFIPNRLVLSIRGSSKNAVGETPDDITPSRFLISWRSTRMTPERAGRSNTWGRSVERVNRHHGSPGEQNEHAPAQPHGRTFQPTQRGAGAGGK